MSASALPLYLRGIVMKKYAKTDPYWNDQSLVVEAWLVKKGFDLTYSKSADNELDWDRKRINIRPIKDKEEMFYTLLHECGHILVETNDKGFKDNYKTKDFRDWHKMVATRDSALKVSILADEMEAWNRGRRLAKRLNLRLNEKKYKKIAGFCVWAYAAFMAS